MSKTVPKRSPHARAPDPMCGEMRKSGSYEQKTGGYEQCCSERTEQIRSRATDKIKKKELNDNPYLARAKALRLSCHTEPTHERMQSQACLSFAEREGGRRSQITENTEILFASQILMSHRFHR